MQSAKVQPPQPSDADVEHGAEASLRMGLTYERGGRFEEAEAAFSKAIEGGSSQIRQIALQALDRVILKRERAEAELQSRLGEVYELEGRLDDAEAAYLKAIEKGPPAMRLEVLGRIRRLSARRESFVMKYLSPALEVVTRAIVYVVLVLALIWLLRRPLTAIGQRRGRRALDIAGFAPTSGSVTVGATFSGVLEAMHERMVVHFQRRTILRNSTLPTLAGSQSAELADIVGAVNASVVPFLNWVAKLLYQPAYRLSGSIECTVRHVSVLARLEHSGTTIQRWHKSFLTDDWFEGQRDLAYEILLRLKEHADEYAP